MFYQVLNMPLKLSKISTNNSLLKNIGYHCVVQVNKPSFMEARTSFRFAQSRYREKIQKIQWKCNRFSPRAHDGNLIKDSRLIKRRWASQKEELKKQPLETLYKKGALKVSQNSQENNQVSFLIKLQAEPATLLKKRLWHRYFPVSFVKFLRTPFLQNTSGCLLLEL